MGKPRRYDDEFRAYLDKGSKCISGYYFDAFGLNEKDYDNLKWEDEPVEVFLNLEDWVWQYKKRKRKLEIVQEDLKNEISL